ncbi:MAG: CocE/NonD family hydrolase C-terminal non-catalytic domain-containing protein, partial [Lawsonella clevelandensis]
MWNHIRGNDTDENGTPKIGRPGFFTEVMDFYDHYLKGAPRQGLPRLHHPQQHRLAHPSRLAPAGPPTPAGRPRGLITDDGLAVGAATTTGGGALPANVAARANMKNGIWSVYPAQRHDLRIEGRMDIRIMLSTLDNGLNVIADLYDIAPNGKAMLITRGATPVAAGQKQTTFRTFPTDWSLRKGHWLALRLVNTNVEVYAHVPTGGKVQIMRTWLTVPVGGGRAAPPTAAPPPTGRPMWRRPATTRHRPPPSPSANTK